MRIVLVPAFLLASLLSAWRLCSPRRTELAGLYLANREADATHCLMNAAMAVMLMSLYTATVARTITIILWIAAIALAIRIAISLGKTNRPNETTHQIHLSGSVYHLMMLGIMIYANDQMPVTATHSHMTSMHGYRINWIDVSLGAFFIIDAVTNFVMVTFFPRSLLKIVSDRFNFSNETTRYQPVTAANETRSIVKALRISVVPHLIMDIGMTLMLLAI